MQALKKTKKRLMILIQFMTISLIIYSTELPKEPTRKWQKLNNNETYNIMRNLDIAYTDLKKEYNELIELCEIKNKISSEKDQVIMDQSKIINRLKKNKRFGFGMIQQAGITEKFQLELITNINFLYYLMPSRLALVGNIYVKNRKPYGGGGGIGFLVNL